MAGLCRLEKADRAFYAKHLLDPLPLFGKPVVQSRTTYNLAVFQSPVSFVPSLCLLPSSTIRSAIFKEIGDILFERRLVVFGNEHVVSFKPLHLGAKFPLRMQRIQAENASFDRFHRQ